MTLTGHKGEKLLFFRRVISSCMDGLGKMYAIRQAEAGNGSHLRMQTV